MPLSVTIPTLGKPKSVKDAVISVLSHEWPLSARRIYTKVKSIGLDVSYQAVHKAIIELLEQEILSKVDGGYQISAEWAKGVKDFGEMVTSHYGNKNLSPTVSDTIKQGYASFTLGNLYEYYQFTLNMLEYLIEQTRPEDAGYIYFRHMYWALQVSDKEYKQFKRILQKRKAYMICTGNTHADKMMAKFYSLFNVDVKLGVSYSNDCDFFVGGDYIIQIYFPDDVRKMIEDAYSNMKDEAVLKKFYDDTFHKKTEINVVVMKNQRLAEQLRSKVMSYFKKGE